MSDFHRPSWTGLNLSRTDGGVYSHIFMWKHLFLRFKHIIMTRKIIMLVLPLLLCYKNSFFQTSKQQQLGTVCVKYVQ